MKFREAGIPRLTIKIAHGPLSRAFVCWNFGKQQCRAFPLTLPSTSGERSSSFAVTESYEVSLPASKTFDKVFLCMYCVHYCVVTYYRSGIRMEIVHSANTNTPLRSSSFARRATKTIVALSISSLRS